MNNLVGSTISQYQILVKIRETPTRVLYRAYNIRSQTHVALEIIKTSGAEPSELLNLINEQVSRNAELTHPNIAPIADTGIHGGLIYIVYNFSPAQPLRRFFNRTYSWKETSRELAAITHAMAYAHEKEVVHGWLHPSSILLDEKRNPILFDFGLEQIINNYVLAYAPGAWINRWGFEYHAPEQLNGALPDARCDIYAMGMILHEWLTGKILFLDSSILDTLRVRKTASGKVDKNSSIPLVIQNLIQKCIATKADDRYRSMQEVYIVLARGALDMSITRKMVRKPLAIPAQRFRIKQAQIRQAGFMAVTLAVLGLVLLGMNLTGFGLGPSASSTPTLTPPATALNTAILLTSTPTQEAIISNTPTPDSIAFPVFQNTPLYSAGQQNITKENINQMVPLGIWGMGDVNHLTSSADGKHVAVVSSIGIYIFDQQNLQLEKFIDTRAWMTALAFSPDGSTLAAGDRDGLIRLWHTDTWQEFENTYSGHTRPILDLAFSPDGTRLASIDLNETLIQWKLQPGDEQSFDRASVTKVTAIAYSGDSTKIVTGGNDLILRVLDASDLSFVQKKDFPAQVVDIATIKGSNVVVIGGNDQSVSLFDIGDVPSLKALGRLQYPLSGVATSLDGERIAAADINGGVAIWDITREGDQQLSRPESYTVGDPANLDAPGSPHSIAFSSDGKLIFSALHDGTLRGLDGTNGEEKLHYIDGIAHVKKMAVSPDSQFILTQQDSTLTLWDLKSGAPRYQLKGEMKGDDPFSNDGQRFVVVTTDIGPVFVNIYNVAKIEEPDSLKSQRGLKSIRFINDDSQLLLVYDQAVDLWSMASGEKLKTSRSYDGTGCLVIKDINDENVASITNYDHVITDDKNKAGLCIYEPENWRTTFISESQGLVAYGDNSKLSILNVQSADSKEQNMRGVNLKNIIRVAISPHGNLLAAALEDNSVHIWDLETHEELTSLTGHDKSITDLQFTPDGKLLISTSLDGTIRLWGVPY